MRLRNANPARSGDMVRKHGVFSFDKMSFQRKMVTCITLVMALVLVLCLVVIHQALNTCNQVIFERTAELLTHSASSVENRIRQMQDISYNMIASKDIQTLLADFYETDDSYLKSRYIIELRAYLNSYFTNQTGVQSVALYLPDYSLVAGNHLTTMRQEKRETLMERSREAGGRGVYDFSADHRVLYFARQIRQSTNLTLKEMAVLMVETDATLAVSPPGGETTFCIESRQNAIEMYGAYEWKDGKRVKYGYQIIKLDGKRYFVTFLFAEDSDWTYLLLSPYQSLYGRINLLEALIGLALAGVLFIAVVLIGVLSGRLMRPLNRLVGKIRNVDIEQIDLSEEMTRYQKRQDEIGDLYRAFDSMSRHTKRLIVEKYQAEALAKDIRFKALQMQINPHFLYNTLDSIHFFAIINHQREISTLVESLGALLRHSINESNDIVSLREELGIAREYFAIQKIRFSDRLEWAIEVPESLMDVRIPKLTLQPLLENAIGHGIEPSEKRGMIRVDAYRAGEEIIIRVMNNGISAPVEEMRAIVRGEKRKAGAGIGLYNINQRIKLMYGESYGLTFSCADGQTIVCVHLMDRKE